MELSWKDMLKMYAPFLVLGAINVVGVIYAKGFADGQSLLLKAAERSAQEVKNG